MSTYGSTNNGLFKVAMVFWRLLICRQWLKHWWQSCFLQTCFHSMILMVDDVPKVKVKTYGKTGVLDLPALCVARGKNGLRKNGTSWFQNGKWEAVYQFHPVKKNANEIWMGLNQEICTTYRKRVLHSCSFSSSHSSPRKQACWTRHACLVATAAWEN